MNSELNRTENKIVKDLTQQDVINAAINKIKELAKVNKKIIVCENHLAVVSVQIIDTPFFETVDLTKQTAKSFLSLVYTACLNHTPISLIGMKTRQSC